MPRDGCEPIIRYVESDVFLLDALVSAITNYALIETSIDKPNTDRSLFLSHFASVASSKRTGFVLKFLEICHFECASTDTLWQTVERSLLMSVSSLVPKQSLDMYNIDRVIHLYFFDTQLDADDTFNLYEDLRKLAKIAASH